MANAVETMTTPRSALPNTFTNVSPRIVDFLSQFTVGIQGLQELLGIARPIKKANGTRLAMYTADAELESGDVDPGCVIPYSKTTVVESLVTDLKIEKFAKGTELEDIAKYGADVAITKTDAALLHKLQRKLTKSFYDVLQDDTAAITDTVATWQMAVAMAIGNVRNAFQEKDMDAEDVVVWANTLDAYGYLGAANITVQTLFGVQYVKNFMGAKVLILSDRIATGTVVATPSANLNIYHVDPADADFEKAGLKFYTDETGLIGLAINGNYSTMVGELFAIMGAALWPEFADGIAIMTVDANP